MRYARATPTLRAHSRCLMLQPRQFRAAMPRFARDAAYAAPPRFICRCCRVAADAMLMLIFRHATMRHLLMPLIR